jgi:hypothetical protein
MRIDKHLFHDYFNMRIDKHLFHDYFDMLSLFPA